VTNSGLSPIVIVPQLGIEVSEKYTRTISIRYDLIEPIAQGLSQLRRNAESNVRNWFKRPEPQ
jgi:hypothetical protein